MQSGNTVQCFSYDAQGKVVSVNYNGTEYYYLRNAQGDIVKLIDGSRNTVVEYTYDSWGKLISTAGSLAASLGSNQPFRYREYIYDIETQWYYLQSRYYDPNTCRFISSDVLLSTGQGVLGHNAYAYCGNNPIANSDPLGTAWWHWAIAGALVVGAAVACVVTCGGAAPAIAAVACVANGVTAATTSATVAASVFIGSSTALAVCAADALSTSGSVGEFLDQGNWGTVAATAVTGVLAGVHAYTSLTSVPREAKETYDYVQSNNGQPKPNYKGGRTFKNCGKDGGQVLPQNTTYKEYDIYPYKPGVNRGARRIVIGADGSGWYTSDHYRTFKRFRRPMEK